MPNPRKEPRAKKSVKTAKPIRPVGEVLEDLRLVQRAGGDMQPLLAELSVSMEAQGKQLEREFKRQNAEMERQRVELERQTVRLEARDHRVQTVELVREVLETVKVLFARVRRMEDRMADLFPGMSWPALEVAASEGHALEAPAAGGRLVLLRGGRDE